MLFIIKIVFIFKVIFMSEKVDFYTGIVYNVIGIPKGLLYNYLNKTF